MKTATLLILVAVTWVACGETLAVKRQFDLTPENLKQAGFTVAAADGEGGAVDVTITRDPSKARAHDPASEVELVRHATLEVFGPAGLVVRCKLEPRVADGTIVYRFQLARQSLPHARLTVWEVDDHKRNAGRARAIHLIGGGTSFKLQLADVLKP